MVAIAVLLQVFHILRIGFESHHASRGAHKPCHTKCDTSRVSSDIVNDSPRKRPRCDKRALHNWFVLSPPQIGLPC